MKNRQVIYLWKKKRPYEAFKKSGEIIWQASTMKMGAGQIGQRFCSLAEVALLFSAIALQPAKLSHLEDAENSRCEIQLNLNSLVVAHFGATLSDTEHNTVVLPARPRNYLQLFKNNF